MPIPQPTTYTKADDSPGDVETRKRDKKKLLPCNELSNTMPSGNSIRPCNSICDSLHTTKETGTGIVKGCSLRIRRYIVTCVQGSDRNRIESVACFREDAEGCRNTVLTGTIRRYSERAQGDDSPMDLHKIKIELDTLGMYIFQHSRYQFDLVLLR